MDSKDTNECLNAKKRKAANQLKRRDTYSRMPPHTKEALLLARRMRKTIVQHVVLKKPTTAIPEQALSCWYSPEFPKQTALTIREPLTPSVRRHQVCATSSQPSLGKGKGICYFTGDHEIVGSDQPCATSSYPTLEKGKGICRPSVDHLCPTTSRAALKKEKSACLLGTISETKIDL